MISQIVCVMRVLCLNRETFHYTNTLWYCMLCIILWTSKKDFCHLERSYLLLLCDIGYNVVKWSSCELKRDLLYFLNICNDIISQYINANLMEQCF